MENNKSPVNDGIPAEFYKIFWNDNSVFYIKVINTAHELGKLSISQRRGKIILIPEKERRNLSFPKKLASNHSFEL